jgi:transcriptional regulator with XRE-family HTH domain
MMGVLGNRITRKREDKNWTQGQLATYAKVDRSYLSLIESGARTNVGSDHLKKIAHALETTIDYLVGLTDDPCQLAVVKGSKSQSLMSELTGMFGERMTECIKLMATLPSEERATICDFVEFVAARRSR